MARKRRTEEQAQPLEGAEAGQVGTAVAEAEPEAQGGVEGPTPTEMGTRDRIADMAILRREAEVQGGRLRGLTQELTEIADRAGRQEKSAANAARVGRQSMLFSTTEEATLEQDWTRLKAVGQALDALMGKWDQPDED